MTLKDMGVQGGPGLRTKSLVIILAWRLSSEFVVSLHLLCRPTSFERQLATASKSNEIIHPKWQPS